MDDVVRKQALQDLLAKALADPAAPYWLIPLIRILLDVNEDMTDLFENQDQLDECQVEQQKALKLVKDQYSELLYHLKSTKN